jgi:lipoprotein-anchoring transpeptidase ErfK/SrfK
VRVSRNIVQTNAKKAGIGIVAAAAFATVAIAQNNAAPAAAPATPPASSGGAAQSGIDLTILHVQVLLDRLGFTPGVIDGKGGQSLKAALRGFQASRGLKPTGEIDQPTLRVLHAYRAVRPTRNVTLTAADVAGPFTGPLPKDSADQAKLPTLGYANLMEKLSEQYHTTTATLIALNSPQTKLSAGTSIRFPNVVPESRDYPASLKPEWKATLAMLNVDARQPTGDHIVVDKSEGVLKVMNAEDKVIAQFPATMGSEHDPLPIGSWKVQGVAYNPDFHYNPKLFWDVSDNKEAQLLPPGPNGPVGVIWMDLNKPHYGIHGTPNPETIGRAESHGCIRLTNWDAARLSLMVKPGTKAVFQN